MTAPPTRVRLAVIADGPLSDPGTNSGVAAGLAGALGQLVDVEVVELVGRLPQPLFAMVCLVHFRWGRDAWRLAAQKSRLMVRARSRMRDRQLRELRPPADAVLHLRNIYRPCVGTPYFAFIDSTETDIQAGWAGWQLPPRLRRWRSATERRYLGGARHVFSSSTAAAEVVLGMGRAGADVSVVGGGTNPFPDVARVIDRSTTAVVFVGRDWVRKGGRTIERCWPTVLRAVPSATLTVVGPRSAPRIDGSIFRGLITDRAELAGVLRSSAVLCLPAEYEPYGLVVQEAMSCGVVPVVTRVGQLPWIVGDGEFGVIVDVSDPGGLAARLVRLLTDQEYRLGLQRRVPGRAGQLSWHAIAARIDAVIRSTIDGVGTSRHDGSTRPEEDTSASPDVRRSGRRTHARRRKERLEVLIWMEAPNPYWAMRLTALAGRSDITFHVLFNAHQESDRDWTIPDDLLDFPHDFLPTDFLARWRKLLAAYVNLRPGKVLTFHSRPRYWAVLLAQLLPGRSYAFYVEKTWDAWVVRTRVRELAKRILFRLAPHILTPGPDAEDYVRHYRPTGTIGRLHHVVDMAYLVDHRRDRSPTRSPLQLLYLGRLADEKGVWDLANAMRQLAPTGRFRLTIVGSGSLRRPLESWFERNRVPVEFAGFVQAPLLGPVFSSADLLVFPTHGDPYGLVVDEALAAGLPVVSSSAAGEIDLRLTAGSGPARGWIYDVGEVDQLVGLLTGIEQDRAELQARSASAIAYSDAHSAVDVWLADIQAWVRH